jgi:hypothetical protein
MTYSITNEKIYGREELIKELLTTIKRGTNRQIQGEKRFGKTTVLKCLEKELIGKYLAINLDCKTLTPFKGTVNFYRFLIAKIIAETENQFKLGGGYRFRSFEIESSKYYEDVYDKLLEIKDHKIQIILEQVIRDIVDITDTTIVLLLDEYEYLMTHILNEPQGFMILRNISDETNSKGIKFFTYILSGSWSWIKMCSKTGSPELNNQGASIIHIRDIEYSDFNEMVINEKLALEEYNGEVLYQLSGGIPFYAKVISNTLHSKKGTLHHSILSSHFSTIIENLDEREKELVNLVLSEAKVDPKRCFNLESRGILKEIKGKHVINGEFLKAYLKEELHFNIVSAESEISNLVETVFNLFEQVNKQSILKTNKEIFESVHDENSMRRSMKICCNNQSTFESFISVLYKCFYERSNKMLRMPNNLRESNIKKEIDSFRQCYQHLSSSRDFRPNKNQIPLIDLMKEYLKEERLPHEGDYLQLQSGILKKMVSFLEELKREISKKAN